MMVALMEASDVLYESLTTNNLKLIFQWSLDNLVSLTTSEYGFIGEILTDQEGPYLKEHGITNIAWNQETQNLYDTHHQSGLEFHNLKTLFGEVIKNQEVFIANDAPRHPKAGGIPDGHPPLNCFLGIPVMAQDGELIGMVGLANCPQGYSLSDVESLIPFTNCVRDMLFAYKVVASSQTD
jgi:GAF domain-containing protein